MNRSIDYTDIENSYWDTIAIECKLCGKNFENNEHFLSIGNLDVCPNCWDDLNEHE